jgi:hypothetical protein
MKEILLNSISTVNYKIYVDGVATAATGSVTARVFNGAVVVLASPTVTNPSTGVYSFIIPPSLVNEEKTLTVEWTFTVAGYSMIVHENYDVVTPYSTWDYFKSITTYEKYLEAERIARKVIDGYTGQTFGKIRTVYAAEGSDNNSIRLSHRLLELDDVTWIDLWYAPDTITAPDYPISSWDITADGWILRTPKSRSSADPVVMPSYSFKRNITYSVDGTWGWESVPTGVEEASKILTANLLCQDQKYRDKYLDTLKTGDWNIRFSPLAFSGTGSAVADDLLLEYRMLPGIGVI